jgi:hypothetical protein
MPYPESCPECGGTFRNTGTHFTARRNEVGRHVLLELGCQNTSRRFWWDFTSGSVSADGRATTARSAAPREALVGAAASTNGAHHEGNGHVVSSTAVAEMLAPAAMEEEATPVDVIAALEVAPVEVDRPSAPPAPAPALVDAFVRQLQLDRLTLRQMRSLLMSDEARRAIEVAVGATEATYERLALILFGADLSQLLGKQAPVPAAPSMSAEERLELQREKARIRARLRRAAIKAAKQTR